MTPFDMDFNKLVQETMNHPPMNVENDFLFESRPCDHEEIMKSVIDEPMNSSSEYPISPGLVFYIQGSAQSFRVECYPTHDIESFFLTPDAEAADHFDDLHYIETDYFELAQVIEEQVKRRRFSLSVEDYFNISDPSADWWMKVSEHSFKIFFHSQGFEEAEGLYKLGPIGDPKIATTRLSQMTNLFKSWFPLNQLKVTDKFVEISTLRGDEGEVSENFLKLRDIFLHGHSFQDLYDLNNEHLAPTYYFYFNELSAMRRFWIKVQDIL